MSLISVYKRERSPYWYFDVSVDGKRKRVSTKRTVKREAEKVAEEYRRDQLNRAQLGENERTISLSDAIHQFYLPKRRAAMKDKPHFKNRWTGLTHIVKKVLGEVEGVKGLPKGVMMHDLTTTMLRQYRIERTNDGAAQGTINQEIQVVSAAYHLVEEDYRVKRGIKFPLEKIKGKPKPLLPEEEAALLRYLDPAREMTRNHGGKQLRYFLDAAAQTRRHRQDNYDLAIMLLDTGARFNEIARLTWDMIDTIDWEWMHLYRWKVDNEGHLVITARMKELLQRRYADRGNSIYIFRTWRSEDGEVSDGPKPSAAAIGRAMDLVGINAPDKVARYGRRSAHSLRDTFATKLRKKGVGLDRLQVLLGHSTPQMTQKYAELTVNEASREAAAILNSMNETHP